MENNEITREEIEELESEEFKDAVEEGIKRTERDTIVKVAIGVGAYLLGRVILGICKPKLKAIRAKRRNKETEDAIAKNLDTTDDELQKQLIDDDNDKENEDKESD